MDLTRRLQFVNLYARWHGEPLWRGFFKDFIYLVLERGDEREKERERNIDVRNIDQLLLSDASRMHRDWELNPQPRHVSWLVIKLATFHFVEWHPTNWAILFWAPLQILNRRAACCELVL